MKKKVLKMKASNILAFIFILLTTYNVSASFITGIAVEKDCFISNKDSICLRKIPKLLRFSGISDMVIQSCDDKHGRPFIIMKSTIKKTDTLEIVKSVYIWKRQSINEKSYFFKRYGDTSITSGPFVTGPRSVFETTYWSYRRREVTAKFEVIDSVSYKTISYVMDKLVDHSYTTRRQEFKNMISKVKLSSLKLVFKTYANRIEFEFDNIRLSINIRDGESIYIEDISFPIE